MRVLLCRTNITRVCVSFSGIVLVSSAVILISEEKENFRSFGLDDKMQTSWRDPHRTKKKVHSIRVLF